MVLMLWFYISGLVILIGAEMNAVIEHASPYGKDEGEKVPGEKRKIGPAAMRAWIARRRRSGLKAPSADEVREVVDGTAPAPEPAPAPAMIAAPTPARGLLPPARPAPRFSTWAIAAGVLAAEVYWAARAFRSRKRRA
jgi:membrane protein